MTENFPDADENKSANDTTESAELTTEPPDFEEFAQPFANIEKDFDAEIPQTAATVESEDLPLEATENDEINSPNTEQIYDLPILAKISTPDYDEQRFDAELIEEAEDNAQQFDAEMIDDAEYLEPPVAPKFDETSAPLIAAPLVTNAETENSFPKIAFQPETAAETIRKSGLAYSAAIVLLCGIVFGLIIGWFADPLLGTSPWGIVAGIILGSVIGFVQFFRTTSQILKDRE